ncbi:hypothetical protein BH11PLA1_BH11PLA1_04630 [soil metagenome]
MLTPSAPERERIVNRLAMPTSPSPDAAPGVEAPATPITLVPPPSRQEPEIQRLENSNYIVIPLLGVGIFIVVLVLVMLARMRSAALSQIVKPPRKPAPGAAPRRRDPWAEAGARVLLETSEDVPQELPREELLRAGDDLDEPLDFGERGGGAGPEPGDDAGGPKRPRRPIE